MKIEKGDKVGVVCCSNGQSLDNKMEIERLEVVLREIGLIPVFSKYIYQKTSVESGTAKERAQMLMDFYEDNSIKAIFDISGGDIANTLLPYLDYEIIASVRKQFWGYSDLTTIINAIYTKTGKASVLYQIRNLVYEHSEQQKNDFTQVFFAKEFFTQIIKNRTGLYQFPYQFYQGKRLEGIVVGGNIRCFLKLAGTEYFPDLSDKVLLLEARSGNVAQLLTYFSQLEQLGAFQKVRGVILGTFTQMERETQVPDVYQLLKRYISPELPVVKTFYIGHGTDSKAIQIGQKIAL